jgi:hypothetical protein
MNVVYNCHIPEVMGYPEQGYCFRRGDEAFLMWRGYFDDLMRAMWTVYAYDPDPEGPDGPNISQVPLLREWNEESVVGAYAPFLVSDPGRMALAFQAAVAALGRTGPCLKDSSTHGEALAGFLAQAAVAGLSVSVEEWWD